MLSAGTQGMCREWLRVKQSEEFTPGWGVPSSQGTDPGPLSAWDRLSTEGCSDILDFMGFSY